VFGTFLHMLVQMLKRDFRFFHGKRCKLVFGYSRRLKPESTTAAETV